MSSQFIINVNVGTGFLPIKRQKRLKEANDCIESIL